MKLPKLTTLDLRIMETFWNRGACSVREIQEAFPERKRPAYTTVQTTVYRLEAKKAADRNHGHRQHSKAHRELKLLAVFESS